jgi:hypothetical protein
MKVPMLSVCLVALGFFSVSAQNVTQPEEFHAPRILRDSKTGIVFYLESDRRHVCAISPDGKLLWSRNPFVDAKVKSFQPPWPIIYTFKFVDPSWWKIHSYLGPAADFISVDFTPIQFGVIKKQTGELIWMGED